MVDEEGSAPEEDLQSWWPGGGNGHPHDPPANPWQLPRKAPEPPLQAPPELGLTAPAAARPQPDSQDLTALRSEIQSLARMSETVLDTLASQLRQDEQATRQFTEHLDDLEGRVERLSHRLDADMQAMLGEMERMQQTSQPRMAGRLIFVGKTDRSSSRGGLVDLGRSTRALLMRVLGMAGATRDAPQPPVQLPAREARASLREPERHSG